jgi:hypothetical protein
MEEHLLTEQPLFKLYKDRAIYIGTFIGGPLVAGYLASENFKKLGQPDKVKMTWIISISVTIIIFGGIFLIPNIEKVPNFVIPLIYTGITQFLIHKFQGEAIKAHIEDGGETFSTWRAVWIGFVGLAILFVVIFAILL